ncbi:MULTISPECIES: response regulator [Maricaulis]|jgi:two-component system chemotaxis response regulator CheY|uniref:Response regulator receiver protein n=1 Tax=Maricaulis maris (strain MCS10) TaxID=394221 RepID=Q0ANK4_MARMM|nr:MULTISPECIES: response regulator [Maricaulis]ABI66133.1 response regulator receiver protein [Maricaulis maris MCS10]MAC88513.1 response regulator [Maricaulis sp.]
MSTDALTDTLSRMTILLVDDSAALRGALRVSLQAFGCNRVVEVDTVERALETLRIKPIDLVITDWKMKPRDGIDLVRTLRDRHSGLPPRLPVVMLSAYTADERIRQARQTGVDAFLTKPFTATSLAQTLRETLGADTHTRIGADSAPIATAS